MQKSILYFLIFLFSFGPLISLAEAGNMSKESISNSESIFKKNKNKKPSRKKRKKIKRKKNNFSRKGGKNTQNNKNGQSGQKTQKTITKKNAMPF